MFGLVPIGSPSSGTSCSPSTISVAAACTRWPQHRLVSASCSRTRRRPADWRSPDTTCSSRSLASTGDRVAAVGFCFGGVMALELARSGVPLRAAVGFHPGFASRRAADSAKITASVLMICGADDPVVSADDRRRFEDEMRDAHVADWRLEVYGGVGHSFTNPDIASRGLPGLLRLRRAGRSDAPGHRRSPCSTRCWCDCPPNDREEPVHDAPA